MSYCAKLTGEDLSRYLNKIESLSLRKSLVLSPESDIKLTRRKVFTFLCPTLAAFFYYLRALQSGPVSYQAVLFLRPSDSLRVL